MVSFETFDILKAVMLIVGYALIGGGIKYIDQAFDENVYNKRVALFFAVVCGLLMASFMAIDQPSAMIFLSIILGVAISRKIDNAAFYIGVTIVLLGAVFYRYFSNTLFLDWAPVAALALSGLIDEIGNDLADRNVIHGLMKRFFDDRFFMKVMMLLFVAFGVFHWVYFFAFLSFDIAYMIVGKHSETVLFGRRSMFSRHSVA